MNLIINYDLFEIQEAQLNKLPQFQELFDETHKKKGTDDYISKIVWEVAVNFYTDSFHLKV